MSEIALGMIDVQRGFMPAEEQQKYNIPGFGELPVADGETIVPYLNKIVQRFEHQHQNLFTTQDWHPKHTAHFSDNPDFKTNWPVHCVEYSDGSNFHPLLEIPPHAVRFKKGTEELTNGENDLSYSGYNSHNQLDVSLGDWLRERQITKVILGGLALDYCVGKTAIDLRTKMDLEVVVAIDATRGIAEGSTDEMLAKFRQLGIEVLSTSEIIATLPVHEVA